MGYELDESQRLIPNEKGEVNYSERPAEAETKYLMLHHTAVDFKTTLKIFNTPGGVSAHYLVPDFRDSNYLDVYGPESRAFQLVDESKKAWHAGVSAYGEDTALNETSIGIELVLQFTKEQAEAVEKDVDKELNVYCKFKPEVWPTFDEAKQIEVLVDLCKDILARNPDIKPWNVVGHSDIAFTRSEDGQLLTLGRKVDPAPTFPWKRLAEAGVGLWPREDRLQEWKGRFDKGPPSNHDIKTKLQEWGYHFPSVDKKLDKEEQKKQMDRQVLFCLRTFQMRFRPEDMSGVPDPDTLARLYDLVALKKEKLQDKARTQSSPSHQEREAARNSARGQSPEGALRRL